MKRFLLVVTLISALSMSAFAQKQKFEVKHVEPLSWWVGMTTDLQIMVNGSNISLCDVQILPDNQGVSVKAIHKAESPNYLFVDVAPAIFKTKHMHSPSHTAMMVYTLPATASHSWKIW